VDVVVACDVLYGAQSAVRVDGDVGANHEALLRSLADLAATPPAAAGGPPPLVLLALERRLGAGAFEAAFFAAAATDHGLVGEALVRRRLRDGPAYNPVDVVRLHRGALPPGAVPYVLEMAAEVGAGVAEATGGTVVAGGAETEAAEPDAGAG